ncbi:unnamed protein product [Ambrosiozyma monospora]|uniref:Unnamed protein product n=1 Tax=Ambrosiozyma monospora TaxID=43982 RepID=A0ACB5TA33_AMBMO|nr:unnamed protein product [Ambrosiozyma monospora]
MELVDSVTAKESNIVEWQLKRAIKENREHVSEKLVDDLRVLDQEFAYQRHRQWLLDPGSVGAVPSLPPHSTVPPVPAPVPAPVPVPVPVPVPDPVHGSSGTSGHALVNIPSIPGQALVPSQGQSSSTTDPTEPEVVVIDDDEPEVEPVGEKLLADEEKTKKLNRLFEDGNGLLTALADVVSAVDEKENPEYYEKLAAEKKNKADWAAEKYRRSRKTPYDKSKYEHVIVID